jgi:hypothetical protein
MLVRCRESVETRPLTRGARNARFGLGRAWVLPHRLAGMPTAMCVPHGLRRLPPSILGGEELARSHLFRHPRLIHAGWSNYANTLFLVAFNEHGGNYDQVQPRSAPPPDPAAPPGEMGFRFDRSGVRIPTLAVSAYIDPKTVVTEEYRNHP